MRRGAPWLIESYGYRSCADPAREYPYAVSLHNHSCHSVENLSFLNQVARLGFMRPFRGTLQKAFGLDGVSDLSYADVIYNPPYTPEALYAMESDAVKSLGFGGVHFAITDHDEFQGNMELRRNRPDLKPRLAISEEVSMWYHGHLFHLGVSGLPEQGIDETHRRIQDAAQAERHDELFEILAGAGALVVLNHPLVYWGRGPQIPVEDLLTRYGWAIHALEVNGMRRQAENDRVLELARRWKKPVVGGGDSHLLVASSVICVTKAGSFEDFIAEVKDGHSVPLIKREYFAPLRWKMFLRVLYFMSLYRQIAKFQGQPVSAMLENRRVMLDPIGQASNAFLALVSALGLAR